MHRQHIRPCSRCRARTRCQAQLALPTHCAGLQVPFPTLTLPLARVAAIVEGGPRLRTCIAAWDPTLVPNEIDSVESEIRDGLVERLAVLGIRSLGAAGTPSSEPRDGHVHSHFRPAAPSRHLQSRYQRFVGEITYAQLLRDCIPATQIRLRSCGGPTSGTAFTSQLHLPVTPFTDDRFTAALRFRIGFPLPPGHCQHFNASTSSECGMPRTVDHAAGCPCGHSLYRRHQQQADTWADIFEEAGGTVRREVYAPCFDRGVRDPILDIQVLGITEFDGLYFDTTIRHPRNPEYPDASTIDGASLIKAASEKKQYYPDGPRGKVITLGAETWGRHSPESEHILAICAALANRNDMRRGKQPSTAARLRRWRCMLDAALQNAVAEQLLQACLPHSSGPRVSRRPTTDLRALEVCPPAPALPATPLHAG